MQHGRTEPDRSASLRLWVLAVAVTWLPVVAVDESVHSLAQRTPWDWEHVVGLAAQGIGGLVGGLVGQLVGQVLRRHGVLPTSQAARRREQRTAEVLRVLRTGELPSDADPGTWRPRIRRQLRSSALSGVALAALVVGGGVVTGVTAHLTSHDALGVWVLAVVLVVVGAGGTGWLAARLRAGRRLLAHLGADHGGRPGPGSPAADQDHGGSRRG